MLKANDKEQYYREAIKRTQGAHTPIIEVNKLGSLTRATYAAAFISTNLAIDGRVERIVPPDRDQSSHSIFSDT